MSNLPDPNLPLRPILQMMHAVHRRPQHALLFKDDHEQYLLLWFEGQVEKYKEFMTLASVQDRGKPARVQDLKRAIQLMFAELPPNARKAGPHEEAPLHILDFLLLKYIYNLSPKDKPCDDLEADLFNEISGYLKW